MSAAASSIKPTHTTPEAGIGKDIFAGSATPFIPGRESVFAGIEPGAVGSIMVLVALIGGLGYGGWSVLQEVQKVQFAPIEQTPTIVAEIDPLSGATSVVVEDTDPLANYTPPSADALDRLYRPQALEVPVLVARDAPISTLNPGVFQDIAPVTGVDAAVAQALITDMPSAPVVQVNEGPVPEVEMVAVRPAWVRVRAADGSVIFEGIMDAGDTFVLPATEEPATLRVGESGAIYFAVNGTHYGPAGDRGQVTSNLALSVANLTTSYTIADPSADSDLKDVISFVAELAPEN